MIRLKATKIVTYSLILIIVLSLVLAACTSTTTTTATSTVTSTKTATSSVATTSSPSGTTPSAAAKTKITIGAAVEPDALDPTTTAHAPSSYPYLCNIFESLFERGFLDEPMGTYRPCLATSWKTLENGKVYEFTLRKGVKFSNGDPLTAADVVFSHERSLQSNRSYQNFMGNIDYVEAVDDYTVRFVFKSTDVTFLPNNSLMVVSKTYFDRVGEETFKNNPIGTGPYKFVEWKTGEHMKVIANENYWGDKPQIKEATFLFIKEFTTQVSMLKAGEVDMIVDTPWHNVEELDNAGYKLVKVPGGGIYLRFHTRNPNVPWYDKKVRQAITYAINPQAIVDNIFYGIPTRAWWRPEGASGYDPNLKPYSYDTAKAKQLLAEAGYPDGFEMPLYYNTTFVGFKEISEAIGVYLQQVGIKVNISGVEMLKAIEINRGAAKDPASVHVSLDPLFADALEPIATLIKQMHSTGPTSFYSNPEIDNLIMKASATADDTERDKILKEIFAKLNDDCPVIPLVQSVYADMMSPNVTFNAPLDPDKYYLKDMIIK